jgi:hypothetical protein
VICIDELGPLSATTYPTGVWKEEDGLRATYSADYGRRGKTWVFGAFEPATGQALTLCHPKRDSKGFIRLLDKVFLKFPAKSWVFIWDNLSTHLSRYTQLALLAYSEVHQIKVLLLPKYAAWLNLIEPWWKQLRSLALKGKRFENVEELIRAIYDATEYWLQHSYPYIWGKSKFEKCKLFAK